MKKNKFLALGLAGILLVAPMSIGAEEREAVNNEDFKIVKEFGDIKLSGNSASVNFDDFLSKDDRMLVEGYGESYFLGGKWTYGLSSINVWSRYKHKNKYHSAKVENRYGERNSGKTKPGIDALASLKKANKNNRAYAHCY